MDTLSDSMIAYPPSLTLAIPTPSDYIMKLSRICSAARQSLVIRSWATNVRMRSAAVLLLAFPALLPFPAWGQSPESQNENPSSTSPPSSVRSDSPMEIRWWKGNLHTHSFWSDGNDFPEMISDWYKKRQYNFLAISDHNTMQSGMRWMKQSDIVSRGGKKAIEAYRNRFGSEWVESRGDAASESLEFRLKPLDEYRYMLEEQHKFILIPAEEITDKAEGKPVHMNATNVGETIKPVGGATVREAMENNLRAVLEQEKKLGREILVHLNHPNFGYGITFEDLAAVMSERFFEVYNGHPSVNHLGDKDHPGIERIWDLANHLRVNKLGGSLLLGVATDDSHEYHGTKGATPGRGWVMVRSRYLTPEHLIRAMEASDFYASSGIELKDVQWDADTKKLSVEIAPESNATYTVQYVVTSRDAAVEDIGRIAFTSNEMVSSYQLRGDETIVRAVITSSLAPENPVWQTQKKQAWTQPFLAR